MIPFPNKKYLTVYADPPWPQGLSGKYRGRHKRPETLPYKTMAVEQIMELPVPDLSEYGCHLWLWTTNQFLHAGFHVMEAWGFKYLAPITWVKPSGCGNYFVGRTQTVLFGYKGKCIFLKDRYKPTVISAPSPKRHSEKPQEVRSLIEGISPEPRIELFARQRTPGWDVWGDEVRNE